MVLYRNGVSLLLMIFLAFTSNAQIQEIPLSGNPRLYHQPQWQGHEQDVAEPNLTTGRTDVHCIAAGQTILLCPDTTGIGLDPTFQIVDCGSLAYGTAQLVGGCIEYTALPGVIQGTETVCIEICSSGGECETISFTVSVHRASINQLEAPQELLASAEILTCVPPDPDFQGSIYHLIGPVKRPTGMVITLAECFRYIATRSAGRDTVIYRVQHDECLSDTFSYPFVVITDTLSLPFFDDFSYPGPYPDPTKWVDDKAFINDQMAIQPPSIGVATMDGLDERGRPYNINQSERDFLTSAFLDLSPYPESQEVILSFYLQPKGLGFKPDTGDSLILEFKDQSGHWVIIRGLPGLMQNVSPPFTFYSNAIDIAYRYKGFQFRFRNRSNLTGALDHWHIDYVRISVNESGQQGNEDIAFTKLPPYLINRYTAMPWPHIRPNPQAWLNYQLPIGLFNHFDQIAKADPSEVVITELLSGQVLVDNLTLLELPPIAPVNQRDLDPGPHEFVNTLNAPGLASAMQSFPDGPPGLALELTYRFEQDQETIIGDPVALANNEVSRTTILGNYYGYDDGTAESAIVANKSGTQVALQFTTTIADTLRAVQFHFPRYETDVTTQYFNLRIWTDTLTSDPVYQEFFVRPFYPDLVFDDSLQAFTTYVLFDSTGNPAGIPIPAGEFFVGWQQGTNIDNAIPIGFDKNNTQGAQYSWQNLTGSWQKFPGSLQGSLMIRPVFGMETPTHTPDLADLENISPLHTLLSIYPNPGRDYIWIDPGMPVEPGWNIQLFDATGRGLYTHPWSQSLDVSQLQNGHYQLIVRNIQGAVLASRPLLIQH